MYTAIYTPPLYWNMVRRVWRYQRGNQNPYIEEEQTTQWPKEKVWKDKQRSTKHTHKTKNRVTFDRQYKDIPQILIQKIETVSKYR